VHSGVYAVIDKLTSQGFDMQFGTNVLGMYETSKKSVLYRSLKSNSTHAGHFYLAKLLLPLLTATAKNSPPGSVRVVNVSSIGHHVAPSGGIRWSTLSPGDDYLAVGKKVGPTTLYNQSKLVMRQVSLNIIRSLIYSSIGQCALLERTRSTIRWRRHCFHLLTPRGHQDRSRA
jgi:NAD(P)-dependent dehydrogenase (short-subunit alcohol dehydrogenase family)